MPTYTLEAHLTLEEQFQLKARRTRHMIGLEVGHLLDNNLVIRPVTPMHASPDEQTSIDPVRAHSGYTTVKLSAIEG
jgi:hypothetical protein